MEIAGSYTECYFSKDGIKWFSFPPEDMKYVLKVDKNASGNIYSSDIRLESILEKTAMVSYIPMSNLFKEINQSAHILASSKNTSKIEFDFDLTKHLK